MSSATVIELQSPRHTHPHVVDWKLSHCFNDIGLRNCLTCASKLDHTVGCIIIHNIKERASWITLEDEDEIFAELNGNMLLSGNPTQKHGSNYVEIIPDLRDPSPFTGWNNMIPTSCCIRIPSQPLNRAGPPPTASSETCSKGDTTIYVRRLPRHWKE